MSYSGVDVEAELKGMAQWLKNQPKSRRKTMNGMKRFCTSWLQRTMDKGGQSPYAKQNTYTAAHKPYQPERVKPSTPEHASEQLDRIRAMLDAPSYE